METHTLEWHRNSLLAEWELIKKYEKETPESERNKEDYLRWKRNKNV